MASLADLLGFFMGQGRDRPSIMSPAVEARDRLFGSGRRGRFEAPDLLEHLGDPMLAAGMAGIPSAMLGAKLMRRAGAKGTNRLIGRLGGSEVLPAQSLDDLAKLFLYERAPRQAAGLSERVRPRARMHEYLGSTIPLSTEAPTGPTVPGMTNMAALLSQGRARSGLRQRLAKGLQGGRGGMSLHDVLSKSPGQIQEVVQEGATPQYISRLRPDQMLDLEDTTPLPQHGGRTSRQVYKAALEDARSRYKAQAGQEFGQRQTVVPSPTGVGRPAQIVTSSQSGVKKWQPTRAPALEEMGAPDLLPAGQPQTAAVGEQTTTNQPMRTIIAGSRDITDPATVKRAVGEAPWEVSTVVSGKARGVDRLGEQWAEKQGIPVDPYPPAWDDINVPGARVKYRWNPRTRSREAYNANAGFARNEKMLENADALIAVWDGKSPGTGHMVRTAQEKGIPVHIYNPNKPRGGAPAPRTAGVETTRMPWVEQAIGTADRPSKAQVIALTDEIARIDQAGGEALGRVTEASVRNRLVKSGEIMKAGQLTNLARRFVRDSRFVEPGKATSARLPGVTTGQKATQNVPMPSEAAGAPIPKDRAAWAKSVVKGETPLQPGQHIHLSPDELDQVLDRAVFVGKKGTRAGQEALETVEEGRRARISAAMRDKLVPEEQKAAEVGATVTRTGELSEGLEGLGGTASDPDSMYRQQMRDRAEQRLSDVDIQEQRYAMEQQETLQKQRQRQPDLPGRGQAKIEHLPTDKQPSELVTKRLPGDKRGDVRWTPRVSLQLRQAAKEMGSEWDAVAKLRQIAEVPAEAKTIRLGMVDPKHKAMRKLAKDKRLNEIVERIEATAQRAAPKRGTLRGTAEISDRFEELMDWSNYAPLSVKQQTLHKMEAKNPAAAARLRSMWAEFADMKARVASSRAEEAAAKSTPKTLTETLSRPQPAEYPKTRKDAINILLDNRDEFLQWVEAQGDQTMRRYTQRQAANRATLSRLFQDALQERGVRAVKKGPQVEVFSEHALGSPNVGFRTGRGGKADLGTMLSQ